MTDPSVQAATAPRRVSRFVRERGVVAGPCWWSGGPWSASRWRFRLRIREQSIQVGIEGARNMFRMVMLTRNWNASHGGIYVP